MTRDAAPHATVIPTWALAGAAVALVAVTLEVLGSVLGDSPDTPYPGWLRPIAWPTLVRVATWLAAAAGSAAYHVGLHRTSGRRRWFIGTLTTTMFLLFAVGIASDAEWSTWH